MEQPTWDDDAAAWRRYAGQLRQLTGDAYRRAADAEQRAADAERRAAAAERETSTGLRARAEEAEAKLQGLWERSERHRLSFQALMRQKRRDGRMLDRVERLLHDGDIPAAVDVLARRRAEMTAAAAKKQRPTSR